MRFSSFGLTKVGHDRSCVSPKTPLITSILVLTVYEKWSTLLEKKAWISLNLEEIVFVVLRFPWYHIFFAGEWKGGGWGGLKTPPLLPYFFLFWRECVRGTTAHHLHSQKIPTSHEKISRPLWAVWCQSLKSIYFDHDETLLPPIFFIFLPHTTSLIDLS